MPNKNDNSTSEQYPNKNLMRQSIEMDIGTAATKQCEMTTSNLCVLVNKKNNNKIEIINTFNKQLEMNKLVDSSLLANNHVSSTKKIAKDSYTNGNVKHVEDNDDVLVLKLCDLERVTKHKKNGKIGIRRHSHAAAAAAGETATSVPMMTSLSFHKCNGGDVDVLEKLGNTQHHHHRHQHHHHHHRHNNHNNHLHSNINNFENKKKSIGIQHNSIKQKLLPQTSKKNEIIIISDEFRRNALNQQDVVIDRKRKLLKIMKQQKHQYHGSLDDVCSNNAVNKTSYAETSLSINAIEQHDLKNKNSQKKAKSVDNISDEQNYVLDNVGSVELIFISNERLSSNTENNVIILNEYNRKNGGEASEKCIKKIMTCSSEQRNKQLVFISDDYRRNSLLQDDAVVVVEPNKKRRLKHLKDTTRQSSHETSIDDVGNKHTSHAFHSYDEEQEDLESKDLKSNILEEGNK